MRSRELGNEKCNLIKRRHIEGEVEKEKNKKHFLIPVGRRSVEKYSSKNTQRKRIELNNNNKKINFVKPSCSRKKSFNSKMCKITISKGERLKKAFHRLRLWFFNVWMKSHLNYFWMWAVQSSILQLIFNLPIKNREEHPVLEKFKLFKTPHTCRLLHECSMKSLLMCDIGIMWSAFN